MVYSKTTAAHVTTVTEVDLDHIVVIRGKNKDNFKAKMGFGLTYLPFIMMAAVRALKDYPLMNSVVQGDTILTKKQIHMGVAMDSERGLMVPVIRGAGEMDVAALAKAVNDLSVKVRDKKIMPDELTGGTFTVSNPGKKGNLFGTPIISQPQVGILRMGEVVKRAVVVEADGEDAIAIRPMMYLALSYDHRIVDGLTANEFLHRVKEHLEQGDFPV
jgi:2-oxoglutarate dehydrogenase E2 component (dihydrolipoamide succinyltransferase)